MARSRVRGTNGSPRKKNKNRDQLRASVTYSRDPQRPGIYTETKINDGDPTTYGPKGDYGPGPARPNLIRRETRRSVTAKEARRKLGKAQQRRFGR